MSKNRLKGAIAVLAVLGAGSASAPAIAGDSPTTVGVRNGFTEFSFTLSRTKVDPGPAIIQYQNTGEDPHDLQIRRRGGDRTISVGELLPGGVELVTSRLKRDSRYALWCSLDGHRDAGMEAVLEVRNSRR